MEDLDNDDDQVPVAALPPLPPLSLAQKLPRGYLSTSQATQYLKCGAAYEFRYIFDEQVKRNSYMVQGSALHKGAEMLHLVMMDGGTIPPLEYTIESYVDAHKELFDADVVIEEEDISIGHIKDVGVAMISVYHQGATGQLPDLPRVYPVAVEKKYYVALQPEAREPIPFLAIVDLEEPHGVRDVKTKRQKGSQAETDNSLQLSLYAAATGKPDVALHQLIKPTKTMGPRYLRTGNVRTPGEQQHAIELLADVAEGIVAGHFPRSTPDAWWCTERWCAYWGQCRGKKW